MNIDDYITDHFDEITEFVPIDKVDAYVKHLKNFFIAMQDEFEREREDEEDGERLPDGRYETDYCTIGEVNQALDANVSSINDAMAENYNRCQDEINTLTEIAKLQRDLIEGTQNQVDLLTKAVMDLTTAMKSMSNKTN